MDKKTLNTILTGLCTGRALATEQIDSIVGDDYLSAEEISECLAYAKNDLSFIQEAIDIVEKALKEEE